MRFSDIHHVGVRVRDIEASCKFYVGVLGLERHPEKGNWLRWNGAQGWPVHLMPAQDSEVGTDVLDLARHFAIEVDSLESILAVLLDKGMAPFQSGLNLAERRTVTSKADPLDFGIGTLFVEDPDGNIVEFAQVNRGIFSIYR